MKDKKATKKQRVHLILKIFSSYKKSALHLIQR